MKRGIAQERKFSPRSSKVYQLKEGGVPSKRYPHDAVKFPGSVYLDCFNVVDQGKASHFILESRFFVRSKIGLVHFKPNQA